MKNRKYCAEINYNKKWCLYKISEFDTYTSIFVIAEYDGITKFVYENNLTDVNYIDSEVFESYHSFFINPIQMKDPIIDNSHTFTYEDSFSECITSCDSPGYMDHSLNQ